MTNPRKCEDCGCPLEEDEAIFCEDCLYADEDDEGMNEEDEYE